MLTLLALVAIVAAQPEHAYNYQELASQYLGTFRDLLLNRQYNPGPHTKDGSQWPPGANALSMSGQRRLDSYSALVTTAIEDGVEGHVIETGVWRGGCSFMAAKTIELLGPKAANRKTYLADSFSGIPDQKTYGAGRFGELATDAKPKGLFGWVGSWFGGSGDPQDDGAHTLSILNNNSPQRVRADAERLGLNMDRLRFVVGYFKDSIPKLVSDEPDVRFAVVRLDGDTFLSTYEAIRPCERRALGGRLGRRRPAGVRGGVRGRQGRLQRARDQLVLLGAAVRRQPRRAAVRLQFFDRERAEVLLRESDGLGRRGRFDRGRLGRASAARVRLVYRRRRVRLTTLLRGPLVIGGRTGRWRRRLGRASGFEVRDGLGLRPVRHARQVDLDVIGERIRLDGLELLAHQRHGVAPATSRNLRARRRGHPAAVAVSVWWPHLARWPRHARRREPCPRRRPASTATPSA